MGSQHGRRHNVRHAQLGRNYVPNLDPEMLRRLAFQTGKVTTATDRLGRVVLRFKLNMEAFAAELKKVLDQRERSHAPSELP